MPGCARREAPVTEEVKFMAATTASTGWPSGPTSPPTLPRHAPTWLRPTAPTPWAWPRSGRPPSLPRSSSPADSASPKRPSVASSSPTTCSCPPQLLPCRHRRPRQRHRHLRQRPRGRPRPQPARLLIRGCVPRSNPGTPATQARWPLHRGASGSPNRSLRSDSVRYMSVTTATQRHLLTDNDTSPDRQ